MSNDITQKNHGVVEHDELTELCIETNLTSPQDQCTPNQRQPEAPTYLNQIKILVINEHQILTDGLNLILKKYNFNQVITCYNLISAKEYLHNNSIDIIIINESMSYENPYEFISKYSNLPYLIKVILLINSISDTNLQRALNYGVLGFISKSENVLGLLQALKEVFKGKKFFSNEIKKRLTCSHSHCSSKSTFETKKLLLSPREAEVLCCVAKGMKAKVIGHNLKITPKTVERHKSNIMVKLGLNSQVDLAIYAVKEGFIEI